MIVRLPFPPSELMPNRSKGRVWQATKDIRSKYRDDAYALAKKAHAAGFSYGDFSYGDGNIPVSIIFSMPDKRHRDLDNCLAATKHAMDGIAQALGVNDSRFKPLVVDSVLGEKPGCVIVAVGVHVTTTIGAI